MAIKDKALRGLGLLLSLIRLYAQSQGAEFKIKPPLQITVHVYNAARVPSGDLIRAEENAARIFKKAQVIVIWAAPEVNHQAAHEQLPLPKAAGRRISMPECR